MRNIERIIDLHLPVGKSAFLWGPRKVGKSYWLNQCFPQEAYIDLLKTDTFYEYSIRPALLRERFANHVRGPIIIDEIQKIPNLLNEVHWLIANRNISFLLTGSSARKLKRNHANLLGGRAWRREMMPLCYQEVQYRDVEKVVVSGLLPSHYLSSDPREEWRGYVMDYLKEEIAEEASSRSLPAFHDFLNVVAITNGELLNYTNVARESGAKVKDVREFFSLLEDTLLGFRLPPWRKAKKRRLIETEKFYLFDVGLAQFIAQRSPSVGTPEFGKAFEHLVLMELRAFQAYRNPELPLYFFRTAGGHEIDFILGNMEVAIEVKGSQRVHEGNLRALVALREEWKPKKVLLVCLEKEPRETCGIKVLPVWQFFEQLWAGEIIS